MSTVRLRRRCSSASGRLQTHNIPSLLSELWQGRDPDSEPPQWVLREQLDPTITRRRSVTLGEVLSPQPSLQELHCYKLSNVANSLLDENISVEKLQTLKSEFEEEEKQGGRSINLHKFHCILKKCYGLTDANYMQIEALFKKIDYSGQGRISWRDFCAHMLQEYREKEDTVRRWKRVSLTLPAQTRALSHGGPVVNIQCTQDGTIFTVREDGSVRCWSPDLSPLKTKYMFSMGPSNKWSKWASAFTLMPDHNKLLMGTGDREIQVYELSTLEPYCQINALDVVPLTLDFGYVEPDKCCIMFGDTEGCVNIILISSVEDTLRLWNKLPLSDNFPTISMDNAFLSPRVNFVRWKVHRDWVTQAKYFPSFQSVVSSSNEDTSSLAIGCVLPLTDAEQQLTQIWEECYDEKVKKNFLTWTPQLRASCDQKTFSVHKGVASFDLCEKHSLLVTGGMDHLIRLWNPVFSEKPTGILKGHPAPVVHVYISSDDGHIFSVSSDITLKIWDVVDQCCLFTADPEASGIVGDISACLYSPSLQSLYVAADSLAVLPLNTSRQPRSGRPVSHSEPVVCCGYSQEFRQVVSCTDTLVKVWDGDSGRQVFEFGGSPGITCMTLDPKGRRLFTGSKDGCLRVWNFNNGQCLKMMKKDGVDQEVCSCMYLKVHQNLFVLSVGRSCRINTYSDLLKDPHHTQRPRPSWHDDQGNGHKDDILSLAEGPFPLVATGSLDGHILVWNVVSGRIQCRLVSPTPEENQNEEGLDISVPSVLFLKQRAEQPAPCVLLSCGAAGDINVWSVVSGGTLLKRFKASQFHQKITKLCKNEKETLLYAADQIGYIYIYSAEKFSSAQGLGSEQMRADYFWRAHTSQITGLHAVDSDRLVLTSSSDHTVRLWSSFGEFIGTFGEAETWNVHIPMSWKHPTIPHEVLVDPLSVP